MTNTDVGFLTYDPDTERIIEATPEEVLTVVNRPESVE